jgi:hypothetical protein
VFCALSAAAYFFASYFLVFVSVKYWFLIVVSAFSTSASVTPMLRS